MATATIEYPADPIVWDGKGSVDFLASHDHVHSPDGQCLKRRDEAPCGYVAPYEASRYAAARAAVLAELRTSDAWVGTESDVEILEAGLDCYGDGHDLEPLGRDLRDLDEREAEGDPWPALYRYFALHYDDFDSDYQDRFMYPARPGASWQADRFAGQSVVVPGITANDLEARVSVTRAPRAGWHTLMVEDAEGMAIPVVVKRADLLALAEAVL